MLFYRWIIFYSNKVNALMRLCGWIWISKFLNKMSQSIGVYHQWFAFLLPTYFNDLLELSFLIYIQYINKNAYTSRISASRGIHTSCGHKLWIFFSALILYPPGEEEDVFFFGVYSQLETLDTIYYFRRWKKGIGTQFVKYHVEIEKVFRFQHLYAILMHYLRVIHAYLFEKK